MTSKDILERIEKENLSGAELAELVERLCRLNLKSRTALQAKVMLYLKSRAELTNIRREDAAQYLYMSSRTLARKLKQEHTGFKILLNEERKRRCYQVLKENNCPGQEVIELLGLSDLSHFYKSFRRWTGYGYAEARAMLAENHLDIDTIFHRQEKQRDT